VGTPRRVGGGSLSRAERFRARLNQRPASSRRGRNGDEVGTPSRVSAGRSRAERFRASLNLQRSTLRRGQRRCRRSSILSCSGREQIPGEQEYRNIKQMTGPLSSQETLTAGRGFKEYLSRQLSPWYFRHFEDVMGKRGIDISSEEKELEALAVYKYTSTSGKINYVSRVAAGVIAVDPTVPGEITEPSLQQAKLIQSYLIRNKPSTPQTVYRFEEGSFQPKLIQKLEKINTEAGEDFSWPQLTSTTKISPDNRKALEDAFKTGVHVTKPKYNIQYKILTKSGVDITRLSAYQKQQEVLLPLGSKYRVNNVAAVTRYYQEGKWTSQVAGHQGEVGGGKHGYEVELEEK